MEYRHVNKIQEQFIIQRSRFRASFLQFLGDLKQKIALGSGLFCLIVNVRRRILNRKLFYSLVQLKCHGDLHCKYEFPRRGQAGASVCR